MVFGLQLAGVVGGVPVVVHALGLLDAVVESNLGNDCSAPVWILSGLLILTADCGSRQYV